MIRAHAVDALGVFGVVSGRHGSHGTVADRHLYARAVNGGGCGGLISSRCSATQESDGHRARARSTDRARSKGGADPHCGGDRLPGEAPRQAATHFTGMPGLPEPGNAMTPLDRRLSGSSLHPEGCSLAVCVPVGPAGLNLPGSGTSTLDAGPCCHTRRAWPSVLQTMPVSGIRLPPRVPSGKCARVSRSLAVS